MQPGEPEGTRPAPEPPLALRPYPRWKQALWTAVYTPLCIGILIPVIAVGQFAFLVTFVMWVVSAACAIKGDRTIYLARQTKSPRGMAAASGWMLLAALVFFCGVVPVALVYGTHD